MSNSAIHHTSLTLTPTGNYNQPEPRWLFSLKRKSMTLMSSELAAADCSSARVTEWSGGGRGSRTPGESYIIETLTTFSSLLPHSPVVAVLLVFTMSHCWEQCRWPNIGQLANTLLDLFERQKTLESEPHRRNQMLWDFIYHNYEHMDCSLSSI